VTAPCWHIVTGATLKAIIAVLAEQDVVVGLTVQHILTLTAVDDVGLRPATTLIVTVVAEDAVCLADGLRDSSAAVANC
jgi:hypothetical protein